MCKFVCRLLRVGSYFFIDTFKCWTQQKYEKKLIDEEIIEKVRIVLVFFFGAFFML
ncbi:hypothetical protein HMPREF0973_01685 [Prevotella veroralis F0319]|uniref:Uncharacterized protein n=1 Tax=Prevotella veroralis F0319 TaxID=649761 RepID=C9MPY6_9BACT|nr:hypothetical protein HMPREF0973_01685 [Prevotella veroralis F0319]